MARSRTRINRRDDRRRTAKPLRSLDTPLVLVRLPSPRLMIEDRRLWHPSRPYRPALTVTRPRAAKRRLAAPSRPDPRLSLPDVHRFENPKKVAVCVRRQERREVLFAKRKTGKGSKSPKWRTIWSNISCR